jgi:hypothetical protein
MNHLFHGGRPWRALPLMLLLLFSALAAAVAAHPQTAIEETLAGETFQGATLARVPGICNDSGPSTFTYPLGGTAQGPLAGTYFGTITVTLASPSGPVTAVQATFNINDGAVIGQASLIEGTGSCQDFSDSVVFPYVLVSARLSYTTTSPFSEQGEVTIELAALTEDSVHGSPIVFFDAGPFSPTATVFSWSGFFRPVENSDADGNYILNLTKAGQSVPVKFSLGGDQGPAIFAAGYPQSTEITCNSGSSVNTASETVAAGSSSLSYDVLTDTYSYIWQTEREWAGTCRQLDVKLADGTTHSAHFRFK